MGNKTIQVETDLLAELFSNQRYIWTLIQNDGDKTYKIVYVVYDNGILA